MIESILLDIQRIDTYWIVGGMILIGILIILIIRELNAWFWKLGKLIETQEDILSTLEDIRDLLSIGDDNTVREKKETVTEMLEKRPKKVKVEKDVLQ